MKKVTSVGNLSHPHTHALSLSFSKRARKKKTELQNGRENERKWGKLSKQKAKKVGCINLIPRSRICMSCFITRRTMINLENFIYSLSLSLSDSLLSLPLHQGSVNETNYHPQESGVKQNERGKKGWGDWNVQLKLSHTVSESRMEISFYGWEFKPESWVRTQNQHIYYFCSVDCFNWTFSQF